MSGARGAVFVDRDRTMVEDPGYLHRVEDVRLLPGAAAGLGAMAAAGWPLVMISNQSGMALGKYGPDAFLAVLARIGELLAPSGARILAAYYCPHLPEISGPCECRKPGTLLYRKAAAEHGIDLAASWYLGDRWTDVMPATLLGGHGILVGDPTPDDARLAREAGMHLAPDLVGAAAIVGRPGPVAGR